MSEQVTNNSTNSIATQKTTRIVFEGKASEYFGIWIVNLLLSLVTLGIYSAWAKVRRKKYFYNNTLIDNVGFDYHANPVAILKGRIIAVIFFALYSSSGSFSPILSMILGLVLFLAIPWIVVRTALFNARNTSHRGLRFDFVGTVAQARKVYVFLPAMLIFTLGLIYPYISHQRNRFLMSHHRFGLSQFDMKPVVRQFYKVYLLFLLVPLIGILAAIAIPAYVGYSQKAKAMENHTEIQVPFAQGFVDVPQRVVLAANDVAAPASDTEVKKVEPIYSDAEPVTAPTEVLPSEVSAEPADVNAAQNESEQSEKNATGDVSGDKYDVAEPTQEKTYEEMMKERKEAREKAMRDMFLNPQKLVFMLIGFLVYAVFGFGFLGYIQARIGNLVWNNSTLDKLTFKSSLRARDFIWLYMTNILAIICTFGLATPWAQIRMAKYRASKLEIVGDVDFDQFVGDKKEELKATGEEIADFFDIDLSFG